MEQSVDVVELVSSLLDAGKYKEALSVPSDEKYSNTFKDNCWDLVSIIVGKIQDDTIIIKPSLYGACEELLSIIVIKASPEEALLEFIEQVEVAKNDAQFAIVLTPLQALLKKLTVKRGRSLEWCLNSISTYIGTISTPDHYLEGKERLLMDSDPSIRRISKVYTLLPAFYRPFIIELSMPEANRRTKQIIVAFLISLLGSPLIYIDLDPDNNIHSELRQSCSEIINDICQLEHNLIKFFEYLEECNKEMKKSKSKLSQDNKMSDNYEEMSPYQHKDKINMNTLSGLFYVIFSQHFTIPDPAIPQVYSVDYLVHNALVSVVHLFTYTEYGPISKALCLYKSLLNRLPNNLSHTYLSHPMQFEVCKSLIKVAIYSTYDTLRKMSVSMISSQVNKFDYKGRYIIVKYIIETANHSGMIGYAITLYKNSLNEAFQQLPIHECFAGPQLLGIIKKMCYLPQGVETDIIEFADQIITCLNFLRYLALKDSNNITGFTNFFTYIEDEYLNKLRTGLNLSKAHYEVKLKEIEEMKINEDKVNVSVNVGGNMLDDIPDNNKKEIIYSALNAFHLIEGLVARLSESVRKTQNIALPLIKGINYSRRVIIRQYSENTWKEQEHQSTRNDTSANTSAEEEKQYEQEIKKNILEAALKYAVDTGFTVNSITAAGEACGYPGVVHGLFPQGGADLIHYFNVKCNEELVEQMKVWQKEAPPPEGASKPPVEFIQNAVMTRLLMLEPYKKHWARAMAMQALPNNVPNSLATLLSLVDDICYYSGDRSVDFNWYIRRVGLAGIYKASELYFLSDTSPEHVATSNFVNTRIKDAELIQSALNASPVAAAPQALSAAFITAKNMLGINSLK